MTVYTGHSVTFNDRRNTSAVRGVDPNVVPQFIEACRRARAKGEEWIAWIDAGCPELTVEEYKRVSTFKRRKRG